VFTEFGRFFCLYRTVFIRCYNNVVRSSGKGKIRAKARNNNLKVLDNSITFEYNNNGAEPIAEYIAELARKNDKDACKGNREGEAIPCGLGRKGRKV
jgi:hypothetical protein